MQRNAKKEEDCLSAVWPSKKLYLRINEQFWFIYYVNLEHNYGIPKLGIGVLQQKKIEFNTIFVFLKSKLLNSLS